MSISDVSGNNNWWQWQNPRAQASTNPNTSSTTANSTGDSISNTGSAAATGNVATFLQSFSADLQSMLSQLGSGGGTAATSAANPSSSAGDSSSQSPNTGAGQTGAVHHHHHHRSGGDQSGSMSNAGQQLVGEIGQSLQQGSSSTTQINQSASLLAKDVMQALQSYATTAPAAASTSIVT